MLSLLLLIFLFTLLFFHSSNGEHSTLLERRQGVFRLHFDVDVFVSTDVYGTIEQFLSFALLDFEAVLSPAEFACLSVSGLAGPFRGLLAEKKNKTFFGLNQLFFWERWFQVRAAPHLQRHLCD